MTTFAIDDHRNLTLSIKVNGRTRWVTFTFPVLYGNRGISTFSTNDPNLIEEIARDDGMVRPGEKVFYDVSN